MNPRHTAILILEDDANRATRFLVALRAIAPDSQVVIWPSANQMLREVDPYLANVQLISLDHDLNPMPNGDEDPGDGLEVAKYLAKRKPACPIIIHSSNSDRARMMLGELELEGCLAKVVAPWGDDWIEAYWVRVVLSLLQPTAGSE